MLSSPVYFWLFSSLRNNLKARPSSSLRSAISSRDQLLLWRVLAYAIAVSSSAHCVVPSKSFGIEFQPFLESLKAALAGFVSAFSPNLTFLGIRHWLRSRPYSFILVFRIYSCCKERYMDGSVISFLDHWNKS